MLISPLDISALEILLLEVFLFEEEVAPYGVVTPLDEKFCLFPDIHIEGIYASSPNFLAVFCIVFRSFKNKDEREKIEIFCAMRSCYPCKVPYRLSYCDMIDDEVSCLG